MALTRGSGHDRAGVQVGAESPGPALPRCPGGPQHAAAGVAAAAEVSRAPGRASRDRPRVLHALQARGDPSERESWPDDVDRRELRHQVLDQLAREKNLPPKILVVHRFRADMVPDAENIRPTPRVQVVMHMDGWGPPWLKFDSYKDYIVQHPVAFTGFKLFYHNDTKKGDALLTPPELLQ